MISHVIENAAPVNEVLQLGFPDGPHWHDVSLVPLKDDTGHLTSVMGIARDITDRKRTEEALRQSEDKFRTVLDATPFPVAVVDLRDDKISFWSDSALALFGHTAPTAAEWYQIAYPDPNYRSEVIARWKPALEIARQSRKAVNTGEYRVTCRDGSERICELYAAFGVDNLVVTFNDITERRQAEQTLARSNAILGAVNEGASNLICVKDLNGRVILVNPAMLRFLGKSESEVVGKSDLDLVTDAVQRRAIMEDDRRIVESGRSETVEESGLSPRGSWTVLFSKFPYRNSEGEVIGIIGVGTDITEHKMAEQGRLKALTRQVLLNQLQQELLGAGDLAHKLKMVTDGIVDIFEADFCRIWLTGAGDLCEHGCMHAAVVEGPNVCRHKDKCLRLVASSGRYTHANGPAHQRIPFGAHKVGRIASGEEHLLVTNNVASDPGIGDHNWAKRLGLESFAGFRLWSSGGECIGVLSLFSTHAITPDEQAQLNALSTAIALVIHRAQVEAALRQSTERFKLIEESIDEVFWISDVIREQMLYISPAFERIWGYSRQEMYENRTAFRKALHPEDFERVLEALKIQKTGEPYDHEYRIIRPDGSVRQIWDRGFPVKDESGRAQIYVGVAQDVTGLRTAERALQKSTDDLNQIINCIGDPIFVKDRQHKFVLTNDACCAIVGMKREEMIGKALENSMPQNLINLMFEQEDRVFRTGDPDMTIDDIQPPSGNRYTVMAHKTLLTAADGSQQLVGVLRDITELKKAEKEREEMELQLRQAQKLEAIGLLAAGIAHEINTPTQYVSDNTRFLQDGYTDVLKVLEIYDRLLQANRQGKVDPALIAEVEAVIATADLDYVMAETPKALTQSLEGLGRIATIVRAMKEFSHPGVEGKQTTDLNHAIENTVTVCRNEWKYVAEMVLDLDPALPLVPCLPGDFNQVILNLVVNAAQAIADTIHSDEKHKGTIRIATRHDGNWVEIRIGDTGTGIPEKHRAKIFTPFFTTKEVGKGTGQGLAISHSVIVKKHGGTITFETADGKGAAFIIRLPLGSDSIQ